MRTRLEQFEEKVNGKIQSFPHLILDKFPSEIAVEEVLGKLKTEKGLQISNFNGKNYVVRLIRKMPNVRSKKVSTVTYNLEEISLVEVDVFAKTALGLEVGLGKKAPVKKEVGKDAKEQV